MARSIYQLKVSLEGVTSPVWRRILVSANVTLRQAHDVLRKVMGRDDRQDYRFCQDGREFGRHHGQPEYLEDDSNFSIRYCLCRVGDSLGYLHGSASHSIVLEAIRHADGPFPWRVVDGAGAWPAEQDKILISTKTSQS